jgi:peptidoglycan/LPS O-acetylase OafA/YrhL
LHSPNRVYVPQIDELRGFAALLVFYFHASILGYWAVGHTGWIRARTPLDAFLYEGHTGVALFMVLSGFILAKGVLGRPIDYGRFLSNRLLRIAPLVVLVSVYAIYGTRDITLDRALAPFLLLNTPSLALTDKAGLSATLWTIACEFQFYLVAPFLFTFVARDGLRRFLLPAMVFLFGLKLLVMAPFTQDATALWSIPYFSIVGRMNQFLFGIGLAALWPRLDALPAARRVRLGWGLLGGGAVAACLLAFAVNRGGGQYAWHHWRYAHQDFEGLIWAVFIAGYVLADPLVRLHSLRRGAVSLGLISFSLYILHWPILGLALRAFPSIGVALPDHRLGMLAFATILILPPVLVMAGLSYWCVERPFLQARSRYVEGVPDAKAAQASPSVSSPSGAPHAG